MAKLGAYGVKVEIPDLLAGIVQDFVGKIDPANRATAGLSVAGSVDRASTGKDLYV